MHVVDSGRGLPRQAGCVEVVDVAHLGVQDVEDVEIEPHAGVDAVADARVHEAGGVGGHAVVFDERARTEVAVAQLPGEAAEVDDVQTSVVAMDRDRWGLQATIGGPRRRKTARWGVW